MQPEHEQAAFNIVAAAGICIAIGIVIAAATMLIH